MNKRGLSRREFMAFSAITAVSATASMSPLMAVAARLGGVRAQGDPAIPSAFHESPMLAERVARGELPPVEQRLPSDVLVVEPVEGIGQYGGSLRFGDLDASSLGSLRNVRTHGMFHFNQTSTAVIHDVCKSYQFSDDLKTLTLELREGHRWSDGEPLTVDDILFWWEDVQLNEELNVAPDSFWTPGGQPAEFRKISPTQVEIAFAVPYPVLIDRMGRSLFSSDVRFGPMIPKHYLQQWHIKYNPDANELAQQENFENWTQAFDAHAFPGNNFDPERPTVWAWIPEQVTSDRVVAVRNPYFFQVDPDGNQLPYIDRIECTITGTREVQTLKASSGELDFEGFYLSLKDMPVFKQNETTGNYRVMTAQSLRTSALAMMPNRTVKDPVLFDLFNNLDFRIALSIGINRQAINDTLFFGLATAFPATCLPSMSFFKPEWATAHIEFDPDRANQLLDSLGLMERDDQGFRLRPDGQGRLSMLVENADTEGPTTEICELVVADWANLGLEAVLSVVEEGLYFDRMLANDTQIGVWHLDRTGLFGRANPLFFAFDEPSQQHWASQWALWFQTSGESGIEPPDDIKALRDVFEQYRQALPGTPEFDEYGAQYYEYFSTQLPMIGTVGFAPVPIIVSNRLHNVPTENIYWGADTNFYDPYLPSQWYVTE
jgi:peptide/nickel transport system substrate-binding protein